jgi:AraC-like DNA-binding protein
MAVSPVLRVAADDIKPAPGRLTNAGLISSICGQMRILSDSETRDALQRLDLDLDRATGSGFAFADRAPQTFYGWHAHGYHQLLYARHGTTQLETAQARFLLPAERAAWIPAGLRHRTLIADGEGVSLYFAPETIAAPGDRVRILVAPALMREMILHALRRPRAASVADPLAQGYFALLAQLCGDWLGDELPFRLPRAGHPAIARAMDAAVADPGAVTLATAVAAARVSERTFRRLFARETGMTWQAWLNQARMLAAMGRLAAGARVTDVAIEVGFASLSAFARAFATLTGESPARYRRRVRGRS